MKLIKEKILLTVLAISLTGCSMSEEAIEPGVTNSSTESSTEIEVSKEVEEEVGVPLKDSCVQVAREFQAFFQSSASFADAAQSLALGLTIASADAEPNLSRNLDTYIDLMLKVDSSVRTNSDFQALVEPKHGVARDAVFAICEAEGIRIN